MRRLLPCVWILLAATGCRPRTEIMLGVATDLRAPAALDNVHIDILRDGVPIEQQDWPIPGTRSGLFILPGSFGVYSSDGSTPRIEVIVTGTKGPKDIVRRRSLFSLVGEKTLFLRMGLVAGCMNNLDCGGNEDLTCIEGACRPVMVDTKLLPQFKIELVDHVTCKSGTTFINTGTMEELQTLGDMTCSGPCVENTCYVPPEGMTQALWMTQETPPSVSAATQFNAVWGIGNDLFAVGDNTILHLPPSGSDFATSWIDESQAAAGVKLSAVFGSAVNDVWAVGSSIMHRGNGIWTKLQNGPALAALGNYHMNAGISFGTNSAVMVGRDGMGRGVLLTWNGTQWFVDVTGSQLAALAPGDLKAVVGISPAQIIVSGNGDFIAAHAGTGWTRTMSGQVVDWKAMWADPGSGEGYLVGSGGRIGRGRASVGGGGELLPLENSGTGVDLVSVWGTSLANVFAVGANGTILHSRGDGVWTMQPSGVSVALNAVTGTNASNIYSVGAGGTILFNNGQVVGGTGGVPRADMGSSGIKLDGGTPMNCTPLLCGGDPFDCMCEQTCGSEMRLMHCDGEGFCTCEINGVKQREFFGNPQTCNNPMQAYPMCNFSPMP